MLKGQRKIARRVGQALRVGLAEPAHPAAEEFDALAAGEDVELDQFFRGVPLVVAGRDQDMTLLWRNEVLDLIWHVGVVEHEEPPLVGLTEPQRIEDRGESRLPR